VGHVTNGSDIALSCKALVKKYPDVVAVNGVDLEVERGECFGLLGPNGAGKTTTIEILEGLTAHDAGDVAVLGGRPVDEAVRARMGIALQETQLPDKLTVLETVRLFRSFYQKGRGVDDVIKHLELDEKRNSRVAKLSGGQRQRLALACALVGDPEVLFLDEPTTGLDPQARLKVWEIVLAFKAGGGTVLLTTHYMEEAARLCDRIGILDHGKRIALGTPTELIDSLGAPHVVELITHPALHKDDLAGVAGVVEVSQKGDALVLHVKDVGQALPALLSAAAAKSAAVKHLVTREATLEDVFVHLTGTGLREA
jgi:ABC-2 type transport system ATP-binding protein